MGIKAETEGWFSRAEFKSIHVSTSCSFCDIGQRDNRVLSNTINRVKITSNDAYGQMQRTMNSVSGIQIFTSSHCCCVTSLTSPNSLFHPFFYGSIAIALTCRIERNVCRLEDVYINSSKQIKILSMKRRKKTTGKDDLLECYSRLFSFSSF